VAWRRGGPAAFAVAGLLLGAATLVRGDLVLAALMLPVVAGGAVWRARGARGGFAAGLAMLAGALALMVPWSAYASAHAHHFVPVTDGGAANLYIGTSLPADGTLFGVKRRYANATRRVHPGTRGVKTFRLPQQLVLDAVAARYPHLSRDAALRRAASANLRRYALHRPLDFAAMEATKLWRMWSLPYAGSRHGRTAASTWTHRALAALALLGLIAGLALVRDPRLALLGAFVVLVMVVDVAFVSEPRHVARLMPLMLAMGAAGWSLAAARRGQAG
jgi:hypothetical protein